MPPVATWQAILVLNAKESNMRGLTIAMSCVIAMLAWVKPVHAAQSYDNSNGVVAGNRVRGLAGTTNIAIRLFVSASHVRMTDNSFDANDWAAECDSSGGGVIKDNIFSGGGNGVTTNCLDAGGNFSVP